MPGPGKTLTATLVGLVTCTSTAGAPAAVVVTVWGGEAGVGPPLRTVPAAVMAYEEAGSSPVRVHVDAEQVAVTTAPPLSGVAVRVKGVVHPFVGKMVTSAVVGPVAFASIPSMAGALRQMMKTRVTSTSTNGRPR